METYFADPIRENQERLEEKINIVSNSPIMSGILKSVSGLLLILDSHRQIVAVNDSFLNLLGIKNTSQVLGLRPGEVLSCIHAYQEPYGCGTTKFCSSCGAAIAMVACLTKNVSSEQICSIQTERAGHNLDLVFNIKSHPIEIEGKKFILLFMIDITTQQQRAALERTFFHDIRNMIGGLLGASEIISKECDFNIVGSMQRTVKRLYKEIEIQRYLSVNDKKEYTPSWEEYKAEYIINELKESFESHTSAKNKKIVFPSNIPDISITTDLSLLLRVISNMVINALEATPDYGSIKIKIIDNSDSIIFKIFNDQEIPEKIKNRIFQRNYSTKEGNGRGIGTFSMKLFGEKILGGKVTFETSAEKGTVFSLSLPVNNTVFYK